MTRKYAGVRAYVGMPGSGKTYALAEAGVRALRRGRPVWVNAGFDLEGANKFSSFEEFCNIQEGLVLWDELPIYVNARKWQEFPDGLLYKYTQIRKDQVELRYSAMAEEMVDATVRRVTYWYTNCWHVGGRLLGRETLPPQSFRRAGRRGRREFTLMRSSVMGAYNTFGKVSAPPALTGKQQERFKAQWVGASPERSDGEL